MSSLNAEQLRQKILRFVAIGILLTGLMVGGISIVQLYLETGRQLEVIHSTGSAGNNLSKENYGWSATLPTYEILFSTLFITLLILVAGMLLVTRAIRPLLEQMDYINLQRQISEQKLRHLVEYDQLTGLPNWSQLHLRLGERLHQAEQDPLRQFSVLFINLNRFKTVNEGLGHEAGNHVLRQVAERLKLLLPKDDLLARASGDEFLMCIKIHQGKPDIETMAKAIIASLKQPFRLEEKMIYLDSTIGISLYPDHAPDAETLLRNADSAQAHARQLGQGRYQFFEADMSAQNIERFELESDLRGALERGEFELFYQPQLDLSTGHISGAEALIRWNHPTRGKVPPNQFIPIAEETGLIHSIGRWVLEESCRQACIWQAQGHFLKMSVNLSALQLNNGDIVNVVRDVLSRTGLESRWLELELTESYLFENFSRSARVLKRLRLLGVSLALDDFGTGYSSLSYLRRLTLHRLKIDRSFVKGLPDDPGDLAIVNTILAMAKSLSLEVVAEGVETQKQHDCLIALGCKTSQGFLYAPPESAASFKQHLSQLKFANQY